MKSVFLFCTRLRVYWVELPIMLIMFICISHNNEIKTFPQLYPLIILCGAALLFVLIYFFRAIDISYQEIRYIGRFSSRDSAEIKEGKTLVLTMRKGRKVGISLIGPEDAPDISWMKNESQAKMEICTFRGKTYGGSRTVKRVLNFFGVSTDDFQDILSSNDFKKDYDNVSVTTKLSDANEKEIHIRINLTI